jgi:hypothetical protein
MTVRKSMLRHASTTVLLLLVCAPALGPHSIALAFHSRVPETAKAEAAGSGEFAVLHWTGESRHGAGRARALIMHTSSERPVLSIDVTDVVPKTIIDAAHLTNSGGAIFVGRCPSADPDRGAQPGGDSWIYEIRRGSDGYQRRVRLGGFDELGDPVGIRSIDLVRGSQELVAVLCPMSTRGSERVGSVLIVDTSTWDLVTEMRGAREGGRFGSSLTIIGDVDEDGCEDLVIGERGIPRPNAGQIELGNTYVTAYDPGLVHIISSADWRRIAILKGPADVMGFGMSVAVGRGRSSSASAMLMIVARRWDSEADALDAGEQTHGVLFGYKDRDTGVEQLETGVKLARASKVHSVRDLNGDGVGEILLVSPSVHEARRAFLCLDGTTGEVISRAVQNNANFIASIDHLPVEVVDDRGGALCALMGWRTDPVLDGAYTKCVGIVLFIDGGVVLDTIDI